MFLTVSANLFVSVHLHSEHSKHYSRNVGVVSSILSPSHLLVSIKCVCFKPLPPACHYQMCVL